ncbi:MAG: hypothetical protein KGJ89_05550 [Patescibacteria group bacterium]|nr:hypothetical protein [Patescibacteria group bacterium]MDE2227387.1 hypothetical protein [Patescibacteria group bacterium]
MDTQTNGTNNVQPGNGLDPNALALTKAIGMQENGGQAPTPQDYVKKGGSGERGAYQFTQEAWNNYAGQILGDSQADPTPENQNQVAYGMVNRWLTEGYSPQQIASKWNSGQFNSSLTSGTNKYGVRYDVPAYRAGVLKYYGQLLGEKGMTMPSSPSQAGNGQGFMGGLTGKTQNDFWQNLSSGNITGAAGQALNWAFPIVGDFANDVQGKNQKTFLQQLGDAGLSALWFVPGFGEGADLLTRAGIGAATGLGAGVASSLSQGETLGQAVNPFQASTVFGAATGGLAGGLLPKVSEALGKNFNQEKVVGNVVKNINDVLGGTKAGKNILSDAGARGMNLGKVILDAGALPDAVDGKWDSVASQAAVNKVIKNLSELRASALDKVGTASNLGELRNEITAAIKQNFIGDTQNKLVSYLKNEFKALKSQMGKDVLPSDLEKIKESFAGKGGYGNVSPKDMAKANRIAGNAVKTKIEDLSTESGLPGIKEFNQIIGAHEQALKALKKINGQTVKGGRLGNMLRGHAMGGVAAIAANAMGLGGLGDVLSALAGEGANNLISKLGADNSIANPLQVAILNKIAKSDPEIVQRLQAFAASNPDAVRQAVESGDIGRINGILKESSGPVAPSLLPKAAKKGAIIALLQKAAIRGATGVTNQ